MRSAGREGEDQMTSPSNPNWWSVRRSRTAPRILVAKMGQDGHDRGQKVIATAFADIGFDVDVGRCSPRRTRVARQAADNDVHVVGCPRWPPVTSRWCPRCGCTLAEVGRPDIVIVVGGVIPPGDFDGALRRRCHGDSAGARSSPTPRWSAEPPIASKVELDADPGSTSLPGESVAATARPSARAITLIESSRADHRERAQELLLELMPDAAGPVTSASPAFPASREIDRHRRAPGCI